MASTLIKKEAFFRRVKLIYQAWQTVGQDDCLANVDFVVAAVGTVDKIFNAKSSALQIWLYGQDLANTITVFADQLICILTSKENVELLKPIQHAKVDGIPSVQILAHEKNDKDPTNFNKLIDIMRTSKHGKTLGGFAEEQFSGEFWESWQIMVSRENFTIVDIKAAIAYVMCPKDELEINLMRKASSISVKIFDKFLREKIMDIIDANKIVRHVQISESVTSAVANKHYIDGVDPSSLALCYSPIIQSGGEYCFNFNSESDRKRLQFDVIVCSLGIQYKSYAASISRTFLVNPTQTVRDNYKFVLQIQEHILKLLIPGGKLCNIYNSTIDFVKSKRPEMLDKLTKSFGFAMGIKFKEPSIAISPKCQAVVKKNMVFNVLVGISNLIKEAAADESSKKYALLVADTVLIGEKESVIIMTPAKKKSKYIAMIIEDEVEEDTAKKSQHSDRTSAELVTRNKRNACLDTKLRKEVNTDDKRKQHQRELSDIINRRAKERLAKLVGAMELSRVHRNIISYKSIGQLPRCAEVRETKLFVDKKYETVIMAIFGVPTPFHISTIKNVSQSIEGNYTYLRINYFHPGSTMSRNDGALYQEPDATFLKEIIYRSSNVRKQEDTTAPCAYLNKAYLIIKEIQKSFKTRETEKHEKENLVKQDKLIVSQNKMFPKLKDLFIRPHMMTKRKAGSLEAHTNGFRYVVTSDIKLDLMYNNIRRAFLQPCDGENVILLHFHLRNAIMFGKKKHRDVQFFIEVGEISTDLSKHQHMLDREDLAADQNELALRHKLKTAFRSFCEKVEVMTKKEIKFHTPFRDMGFLGAPFRTTVFLQPTTGNLVNLTDWPPFIITLKDVELVHFERVQFHLRNFDMVFVFKDYHKKVVMVNAIPMSMLDHVKNWLNSCDIGYTEGAPSLNWIKIMKTITDDPEGFFEQGGWSFLQPETENEFDDCSTDSDENEEYMPTDIDSEDESDDNDSEFSNASEDESNAETDDSGKDWSDLEREAAEDDRKHEHKYSAKSSKNCSKKIQSEHLASSQIETNKKHRHHHSNSHKKRSRDAREDKESKAKKHRSK